MRWWGWGDPATPPALSSGALRFLAENMGMAEQPRPPVALREVRLPPPALPGRALERLQEVVGAANVREDHRERVLRAAGKGYPDLVRLRAGEPEGAPDAVVLPDGHDQVRAVLECCAELSVAVVPFGGGTSVVGGVAPLRGDHAGVVALDLRLLDGVLDLDRESLTVRVGAGMRAPALERRLADSGLTLGHFPQSFEYVSLGGCAATRSVGQASSGYGGIARMVLGLRFATPAGEMALPAIPASAAGPGLRELVVGSEGTLGVISELALRVRPAPAQKIYEGVFFEDFSGGVEAMRDLAQGGGAPDVARLSDEAETRVSLALAETGGALTAALKRRLGRAYLTARGHRTVGCLAIFGFEGAAEDVARRRERTLETARGCGGLAVGHLPGAAWLKSRFSGPYLRDDLLTQGVMVETLETAVQWSGLERLHGEIAAAISAAMSACGTPGLVMCHVSHLYPSGASLYFTFLARQKEGEELAQWRAVKEAASRAIVEGGGTLTHHHAVGRDHAPWMEREVGATGLGALRALKAELDPAGIMNPGKLLALSDRG